MLQSFRQLTRPILLHDYRKCANYSMLGVRNTMCSQACFNGPNISTSLERCAMAAGHRGPHVLFSRRHAAHRIHDVLLLILYGTVWYSTSTAVVVVVVESSW